MKKRSMSRLSVEVDDEALEEARALLGTRTKKDTINTALLEVVRRRTRLAAFQRAKEKGSRGDFDQLLVKQNYRR